MFKQTVKFLLLFWLAYAPLCRAEVRIAVIAPKSGAYKIWGDELISGVEASVDELNNQGGVNKKKISMQSIDDPCNDNLSVSTAQMIAVAATKPSLVIGPYCPNNFEKVSAVFAKAKIFQIIPTSLNHRDARKNQPGMIKLAGFKEQAAKDFFAFYNRRFAGHKVALIFDGEDSALLDSAHATADEFRRYGKISLLKKYDFNDYGGDLNQLASAVDDFGNKIVVIWGKSKKIAKMIRNLKKIDSKMVIVTEKYMAGDDFVEYAGDYLDTVYFMAFPPVEDNPEMAETIVKMRLKGIELGGLGIYGYGAVKMWAELAEKSGGFSYSQLAKNARKGNLPSAWGGTFINNGAAADKLNYLFYQFRNGEYVETNE